MTSGARVQPAVDSLRHVETPEGIHLHLRCAGPVPRSLAALIDFFVAFIVLWAVGMLVAIFSTVLGEAAVIGIIGAGFLLSWAYPAICEMLMDGQTFGKRVVGLRVIQANGAPVMWRNALTRSFLLSVDLIFCISVPLMLFSREFRRIGDYAADTVVVYVGDEVRKSKVAWPEGTPVPAGSFSREENRSIVALAERFNAISKDRQRELAGIIAAGLPGSPGQALETLHNHALFVQGAERT